MLDRPGDKKKISPQNLPTKVSFRTSDRIKLKQLIAEKGVRKVGNDYLNQPSIQNSLIDSSSSQMSKVLFVIFVCTFLTFNEL